MPSARLAAKVGAADTCRRQIVIHRHQGIRPMKPIVASAAAAVLPLLVLAGAASPEVRSPEWVKQKVMSLQPTAAERRIDEIGWTKEIREAERLAKEHGRPVF